MPVFLAASNSLIAFFCSSVSCAAGIAGRRSGPAIAVGSGRGAGDGFCAEAVIEHPTRTATATAMARWIMIGLQNERATVETVALAQHMSRPPGGKRYFRCLLTS